MFIAGRHVPFVSITNYTEGGKGEGESPLVYLAPAGRYVYSLRRLPMHSQPPKSPLSGATCWKLPRVDSFVSITNYTEGGKGEGESPLVYLAPEGRHVYSRATCKYLKAPEGRQVRFVSITNSDGLSEWHGGGSVCI